MVHDEPIDLVALRAGGRDAHVRFTSKSKASMTHGMDAQLEDLPTLAIVFKEKRDQIIADLRRPVDAEG